jgi:SP family xylose:H+ symportor-like MFS transporter
LFVWRLVPETKGKTLEDMSKLWKWKGYDPVRRVGKMFE